MDTGACSAGQGVYYTQTCIYILLKVWKLYLQENGKTWPWFAAVRCKQELPLALPLQQGVSAPHPFPTLSEMGEVRGIFSAFGAVPLALMMVIWERASLFDPNSPHWWPSSQAKVWASLWGGQGSGPWCDCWGVSCPFLSCCLKNKSPTFMSWSCSF